MDGWMDDDDTREKSKDRYRRRRRPPEPERLFLFRHIDGPCVHAGLMHASRQMSVDVVVMFLASSDFNRQLTYQHSRQESIPIEEN